MKIIKGKKEELEIQVANVFANAIEKNSKANLLLATGNSPVGVYKNLIEKSKNGLSFSEITSFNLDEYLDIDKFPNDSFRKFMNDNLFDSIDINKSNTFFPQNPEEYNKKIDEIDYFDVTILGVGTNGHIAFNEPGTKFETRTHFVELEKSTIESNFGNRTEYPTKAITMGLFDIYNKSRKIVLLAWGEGKREAIKKLMKNEVDLNCPITHFFNHQDITIYTDLENL